MARGHREREETQIGVDANLDLDTALDARSTVIPPCTNRISCYRRTVGSEAGDQQCSDKRPFLHGPVVEIDRGRDPFEALDGWTAIHPVETLVRHGQGRLWSRASSRNDRADRGRASSGPKVDSEPTDTDQKEDRGTTHQDPPSPRSSPQVAQSFRDASPKTGSRKPVQLRAHQTAQLTMADRHQTAQCTILPSVTPSHEDGEIATVDDDAGRQPVGGRRERRSLSPLAKQQLVEPGSITHPKTVGENLNPRLGAKADRAAQPPAVKAQAGRRELGLGPDRPSVDPHLERPISPAATA